MENGRLPPKYSRDGLVKIDICHSRKYHFEMMTTFEIPQDILESARLTPPEFKIEMAVYLYTSGRLSIGKARELADLSLWQFRQILAARQISPHLDESDLADDLGTLKRLGRI